MTFDIDKAKRESDTLDGSVADFRKACTKASVELVEGSRISFGTGRWGLHGDLAEMIRMIGKAPATHVFIGVERYDLEREIANVSKDDADGPHHDGPVDPKALRAALRELEGLNGLVAHVRAATSLAGVPLTCLQEPSWLGRARKRIRHEADALRPGRERPKGPGREDGDGHRPGPGRHDDHAPRGHEGQGREGGGRGGEPAGRAGDGKAPDGAKRDPMPAPAAAGPAQVPEVKGGDLPQDRKGWFGGRRN